MESVGALILADAVGSGFGGAMALARWDGIPLLTHVSGVAGAGGAEVVVVVIGPRGEDVVGSFEHGETLLILNDDFEEGRASSLRAGLDTMWRVAEIETAVIIELERPAVTPEAVAAVAAAARTPQRPMTLLKYRYARGGPVAVDRSLWPRLMGLEGDVDLLDLAAAHPDWTEEVRVEQGRPARIRTPDDLAALRWRPVT